MLTKFNELLDNSLKSLDREDDGLLHCSSDLIGSLRHTQLRLAGAPTLPRAITDSVRLTTGTLWHEFLHESFRRQGLPFFSEIKVNDGLPKGWSGTADWLFWNAEQQAFDLSDLKTIKGEGMGFLTGLKDEHQAQVSAYYWALNNMGFPMTSTVTVAYLPMNQPSYSSAGPVQPVVYEAQPTDEQWLTDLMNQRYDATRDYLLNVEASGQIVNNYLAPTLEPVQKLTRHKSKIDVLELKLVPHWLTKFCPYPDNICDCNLQTPTKVGEWIKDGNGIWNYKQRSGYGHVTPVSDPNQP